VNILLELKPVVKKFYEVNEEELPKEQAQKSFIRWLLADDNYNFFMRLFRIESGGHINSHFHPWEHEIFILEGKGKIRIGSKVYDVNEGYFIYIPPNADMNIGAESDLKFICISI
jgi:Uncharacterized conserved protein, contains double-stranded beta-helix domain